MGKPSKAVMSFMETYGVESDEIWEVHGSQWVVKHKALERIAAEQNIVFGMPIVIEGCAAEKIAVLTVAAAYCYAMAEKRAKDRVILKLLNTHGTLYSEDEADDFKRPNPHVTKPSDLVEPTEYDEQGHPVDNIPLGDREVTKLTKATARADFGNAQAELRACKTVTHLQLWGSNNSNRVASYPGDWQELMRGIYSDHMADLRQANGKAT
jgi:hypothetical protein